MYACGLRISEAHPLRIEAIDGPKQLLRIIGKGNKERLIPIPTPILHGLRNLWKTHRNRFWIFPNTKGDNAVHTCILYRTFKDAVREAGLSTDITPHALRHSYATRLTENNVDMRIIQILMGHASIQSTTVYTHLTEPSRKQLRTTLDAIMTEL